MSGRFCSKNNTSLLFEQNRPEIRAYFIVFRRYFLWSSNRVLCIFCITVHFALLCIFCSTFFPALLLICITSHYFRITLHYLHFFAVLALLCSTCIPVYMKVSPRSALQIQLSIRAQRSIESRLKSFRFSILNKKKKSQLNQYWCVSLFSQARAKIFFSIPVSLSCFRTKLIH